MDQYGRWTGSGRTRPVGGTDWALRTQTWRMDKTPQSSAGANHLPVAGLPGWRDNKNRTVFFDWPAMSLWGCASMPSSCTEGYIGWLTMDPIQGHFLPCRAISSSRLSRFGQSLPGSFCRTISLVIPRLAVNVKKHKNQTPKDANSNIWPSCWGNSNNGAGSSTMGWGKV